MISNNQTIIIQNFTYFLKIFVFSWKLWHFWNLWKGKHSSKILQILKTQIHTAKLICEIYTKICKFKKNVFFYILLIFCLSSKILNFSPSIYRTILSNLKNFAIGCFSRSTFTIWFSKSASIIQHKEVYSIAQLDVPEIFPFVFSLTFFLSLFQIVILP